MLCSLSYLIPPKVALLRRFCRVNRIIWSYKIVLGAHWEQMVIFQDDSLSGRQTFPCAWWVTSRTCATPGRCVRTRAAAWRRRTAATSRRSRQPRATRTSPTSSHSSSGKWWSTWSTEPTGDATAAPSPWPNSSTMCLARGGSRCDWLREVSGWSAAWTGMLVLVIVVISHAGSENCYGQWWGH